MRCFYLVANMLSDNQGLKQAAKRPTCMSALFLYSVEPHCLPRHKLVEMQSQREVIRAVTRTALEFDCVFKMPTVTSSQ